MTVQKAIDTGVTTVVGTTAGLYAKMESIGVSVFDVSINDLISIFVTSMSTIFYAVLGVIAAFVGRVLLHRVVKKFFPKFIKFL